MHQRETPLGLMLRPASIYQAAICQSKVGGLDDSWRQRTIQRLTYKLVDAKGVIHHVPDQQ